MQCDKDDQDPTGRCGPCTKRGRVCGPRRLSEDRMESIRTNIRNNRCQEIVKWMMTLIPKDRDLLLKQLPADEAERLSDAFNFHALLHSRNAIDLQRFFLNLIIANARVLNLRKSSIKINQLLTNPKLCQLQLITMTVRL